MNERLLQFIWQFQLFNHSNLHTTDGEPLQVLHPGMLNTHQGPDFQNARIRVGSTIWVGSVELHLLNSLWREHGHSGDNNYANVVLHVVWQHDTELQLPFPTLVLEGRISGLLLARYRELMNRKAFIACDNQLGNIPSVTWQSWKERLVAERLEQKSAQLLGYLQQNNFHWEETCWWLTARYFGAITNADLFEALARSLPLSVLARHKNQLLQLEALLFGQAGLLESEFAEDYPRMLQKEYRFLAKKYGLSKLNRPLCFLRMRPFNFPTVRLAQLAQLLHQSKHLFSLIKTSEAIKPVREMFTLTANDYWHYHYRFDEAHPFRPKNTGQQFIDQLLVNVVVPLLFCYGTYQEDDKMKERAIHWLTGIAAEKNNVTAGFLALGITNESAFDSQALIMLKAQYCSALRCLQCAVGYKLMRDD